MYKAFQGNVYVGSGLHRIYYLLKLILNCFVRKNKDNKMCLFPLTGAVLIFFIAIIIISTKSCYIQFIAKQEHNLSEAVNYRLVK